MHVVWMRKINSTGIKKKTQLFMKHSCNDIVISLKEGRNILVYNRLTWRHVV
jgi:hypothetical protein